MSRPSSSRPANVKPLKSSSRIKCYGIDGNVHVLVGAASALPSHLHHDLPGPLQHHPTFKNLQALLRLQDTPLRALAAPTQARSPALKKHARLHKAIKSHHLLDPSLASSFNASNSLRHRSQDAPARRHVGAARRVVGNEGAGMVSLVESETRERDFRGGEERRRSCFIAHDVDPPSSWPSFYAPPTLPFTVRASIAVPRNSDVPGNHVALFMSPHPGAPPSSPARATRSYQALAGGYQAPHMGGLDYEGIVGYSSRPSADMRYATVLCVELHSKRYIAKGFFADADPLSVEFGLGLVAFAPSAMEVLGARIRHRELRWD
ncbi:hypothetical protein C8R46DRAFT_1194182 [Mycena filopes]|nr:hypothetical protein C8R46DRAFT_1194182 [Mycena filopes]